MLRLIVYDISDATRLRHVAKTCEDFGARVQYSVFECWLEPEGFEQLWSRLADLINPKEDRIAAYTLDKSTVEKRRVLGERMHLSEQRQYYLF